MLYLVVPVLLVALVAFIASMGKPHRFVYLGFFTSGVLITANLPGVGTKLALPDLPLVFLVVSVFFLSLGQRGSTLSKFARKDYPILLAFTFVLLSCISFLAGTFRFHHSPLGSMIDFINYVYGFLIMVCVVLVVNNWDVWKKCFISWMLGTCIVGAFAVWGMLGSAPDWVYDGRRISSTLRNVNQMQSYLAPIIAATLLLTMSSYLASFHKACCLALSIVLVFSMLGTGSRSAIVFVGLIIVVVVLYAIRENYKKPHVALVGLTLVSIFIGFGGYWASEIWMNGPQILPESLRGLARPVTTFQSMLQAEDVVEALGPRGEQLSIVADNWYLRPLIGVGPGNFAEAFNHRHEVHNTYAGLLVEHGLLGISAFVIFVMSVLFRTWSSIRMSANSLERFMLSLVAFSVVLLLVYGFTAFGVRQRIFWLTMGLALSGARLLDKCRLPEKNALHTKLGFLITESPRV